MPTGFKNSTDGGVGVAIDACRAAKSGHVFLSVGKEGLSSIVETEGNPDVHVILRGGSKGPNYAAEYVREAGEKLIKAGLPAKLMVRLYTPHWISFIGLNYSRFVRRLTAATETAQNSIVARSMSPRISYVSSSHLVALSVCSLSHIFK